MGQLKIDELIGTKKKLPSVSFAIGKAFLLRSKPVEFLAVQSQILPESLIVLVTVPIDVKRPLKVMLALSGKSDPVMKLADVVVIGLT